jgi:transposase
MNKAQRYRHEREKIRKRAGRLFACKERHAEIARRLGVTRAAVHYWHAAWKKNKERGLLSKGHPGFASRLTEKKRVLFRRAIEKGPRAHGYETNLWTLARLSAVMKKETRVSFGHNRTWQIVRELGFTCQKPQVRARERDEKAIREWKEKRLPGLKKMGSNAWVFSGLRG